MKLSKVLTEIATSDVDGLLEAEKHYGDSWKKRGGVGAFMMLARKWDRLELQVKKYGYDIFESISADMRAEGVIDDIRDLRRYLLLVEAHMAAAGAAPGQVNKGAATPGAAGTRPAPSVLQTAPFGFTPELDTSARSCNTCLYSFVQGCASRDECGSNFEAWEPRK